MRLISSSGLLFSDLLMVWIFHSCGVRKPMVFGCLLLNVPKAQI
jgi:hypothetical protein